MADPLSIAASVTGLIAIAGKTFAIVKESIANFDDAPHSAHAALGTIEDMRLVLESIKHLLSNGLAKVPENRKRMIHISKLVIVFRESILSFSELEGILDLAARTGVRRSAASRMEWMFKEEKISRCIQRLDSHKNTLSAMLTILHCESDLDAKRCLQSLQDNFSTLLQQNEAILRRFEEYNLKLCSENASVRFFDHESSTMRHQTSTIRRQASTLQRQASTVTRSASLLRPRTDSSETNRSDSHLLIPSGSDSPIEAQIEFFEHFEDTLKGTRVYRRARSDECDVSFTSSAIRTCGGWTALSDLSLSDISVVSVIALPISLVEINHLGTDLTFAKMFSTETPQHFARPIPQRNESLTIPSLRYRATGAGEASEARRIGPLLLSNSRYNVVVLGNVESGKTALTIKFCQGRLRDSDGEIREDFYRRQIDIDHRSCILDVLDTTARARYPVQKYDYMKYGDGFIVVYSTCSRRSFNRVAGFRLDISQIPDPGHCGATVLVGHHCDQWKERAVSSAEGADLANEFGWGFVETSTENDVDVDQAFAKLVRSIRHRRGWTTKPILNNHKMDSETIFETTEDSGSVFRNRLGWTSKDILSTLRTEGDKSSVEPRDSKYIRTNSF